MLKVLDWEMDKINKEKQILKGMRALVVGGGRSGISAAVLLRNIGCRVTLSEYRSYFSPSERLKKLESEGITLELGTHKVGTFMNQDIIIISPGVDPNIPAISSARSKNIPIISEIELAYRLLTCPIIAITGTNGKTTTTTLIGEILKAAGYEIFIGGNIGIPLVEAVINDIDYQYAIAEISSFQLEAITSFAPHLAVILNITPDHLDRYKDFDEYACAKTNIIKNQISDDYLILNADDDTVMSFSKHSKAKVRYFSQKKHIVPGVGIKDGAIYLFHAKDEEQKIINISDIGLLGSHNLENIMAAIYVSYLTRVPLELIKNSIKGFKTLEHRMEPVAKIDDVLFINDSKATNADAMARAIESFEGKIILIAGGRDKGGDFSFLKKSAFSKIKTCVLIGEAKEKIAAYVGENIKIIFSNNLDKAVKSSCMEAVPGDIVLFSPGCASFDMFENFEQRGKAFKEAVCKLREVVG